GIRYRSQKLIILHDARLVGQRNEREQSQRGSIYAIGGKAVVGERRARIRIEDRHRTIGNRLRKIADAFEWAGYRGDVLIRIARASAEIVQEEKRLVAFQDFRNAQWTAEQRSETRLRIGGLRHILTAEGEWPGIQ